VLWQTAYACGLRLMEVLNVQVSDIDSARMLVHVRQAKGNKDRLVPLSAKLLAELRDYWRCHRPARWLFGAKGAARAGPSGDGAAAVPAGGAQGGLTQAGHDAHAASFLGDAHA
jgi:integrase/recombinase XerD